MNLYRISQNDNSGYDTYNALVVAAESDEEARMIHPSGLDADWGYKWSSWAKSPSLVTVEYLGVAKEGTPAGIILSSFNAG